MQFAFHTTCRNSNAVGGYGEDINEMTQSHHCTDISSDNFIRKIAPKFKFDGEVLDILGFESKKDFASDWGVRCHKSHFQGVDCYYVRFSGIEHIFVDAERIQEMKYGEDGDNRRKVISDLEELLDEFKPWIDAKSDKEKFKALHQFTMDHLKTFTENNILLASLFAYSNPYVSIVKKIDKELIFNAVNNNEAEFNM